MSTSSELVEDRDDHEIADLIARMEIDDAADLIGQFDGDRRTHILSHLPHLLQCRLRALLCYEPLIAGGLMSPEFVAVYTQATQKEHSTACAAPPAPPTPSTGSSRSTPTAATAASSPPNRPRRARYADHRPDQP
jgi:MgtE intracellular N domain